MKRITVAWLETHNACGLSLPRFRALFGSSAPMSEVTARTWLDAGPVYPEACGVPMEPERARCCRRADLLHVALVKLGATVPSYMQYLRAGTNLYVADQPGLELLHAYLKTRLPSATKWYVRPGSCYIGPRPKKDVINTKALETGLSEEQVVQLFCDVGRM